MKNHYLNKPLFEKPLFEKPLFEQANNQMENKFSRHLPGDRKITAGVPQGSILEPLLLCFLNDIFVFGEAQMFVIMSMIRSYLHICIY